MQHPAETPLDQALFNAYTHPEDRDAANKVWLTLLKSTLYLVVDPVAPPTGEEPFRPLVAMINDHCFLAAFDTEARIQAWAGEHTGDIHHAMLTGRDLLAGMGDNVFLVLNPGTPFHKEFSPDEVKHLKKVIARVDQLKES